MANLFPNPYAPYTPGMLPTMPPTLPGGVEFRYIQGGDNAAKAYQVNPGSTFILMDSESPFFYLKTVSVYGVPQPLRKFKFEEVLENPNESLPNAKEVPEYVTKDVFDASIGELKELIVANRPNYSKNRGDRNGKSTIQRDE